MSGVTLGAKLELCVRKMPLRAEVKVHEKKCFPLFSDYLRCVTCESKTQSSA